MQEEKPSRAQMSMKLPNKPSILLILLMAAAFLSSCSDKSVPSYGSSPPEKVVRTYFESWNNKDYTTQYAQVSDGFKKIDPYATDLETFSGYMSQYFTLGKRIEVVKVKENYNNGKEAGVDYTIAMDLDSGGKEFSDSYTLKLRDNGWKLIHPYGNNIDLS